MVEYRDGELDAYYRSLTEAGIRLPFDIADLRRWAMSRRRRPKGSGHRAGEFLPEINLPGAEPRASTRVPFDDGLDAVDIPGTGDDLDAADPAGTRRRGNRWAAVGLRPAADVEKLEAAAAKRRAALQREADFVNLPPAKKVQRSLTLTNSALTTAENNLQKAVMYRDEYLKRTPGEKVFMEPWVKELLDEHVKSAEAAVEVAREQQRIVAGISDKFDRSMVKGQRAAAAAGRNAHGALIKAREAREGAKSAAAKALKALNARDWPVPNKEGKMGPVPRPDFLPDADLTDFNNPEPGYRIATPKELFELVGNGGQFSGIHIAEDPNSFRPLKKFYPNGKKIIQLSPQWNYNQERAKWSRIERLSGVYLDLADKLSAEMNSPDSSPRDRQNAMAAMVMLETGMRPGAPGNESFPKDEKHPLYKKAKVPTYGATTLLNEHATVLRDAEGNPVGVRFKFMGKSGIQNDVTAHNPDLARHIEAAKKGLKRKDPLFPAANSDGIGKMMAGYGFDAKDFKDAEKVAPVLPAGSPVPEIAEDDVESATGKFKVKDLRTLRANLFAQEYFQRIMDSYGRLPNNLREFHEWLNVAAFKGSQMLGNEFKTFLDNYLSMAPFVPVIEQMIEREKKKSRNRGPLTVEEYWPFGKKNALKPQEDDDDDDDRDRLTAAAGPPVDAELLERVRRIDEEPMPSTRELIERYVEPYTWAEPDDVLDEESDDTVVPGVPVVAAGDLRSRVVVAAAVLADRDAEV